MVFIARPYAGLWVSVKGPGPRAGPADTTGKGRAKGLPLQTIGRAGPRASPYQNIWARAEPGYQDSGKGPGLFKAVETWPDRALGRPFSQTPGRAVRRADAAPSAEHSARCICYTPSLYLVYVSVLREMVLVSNEICRCPCPSPTCQFPHEKHLAIRSRLCKFATCTYNFQLITYYRYRQVSRTPPPPGRRRRRGRWWAE